MVHLYLANIEDLERIYDIEGAVNLLTEERRRDLTKQVKKYGEEGKIAIRNIRRDAMEAAKKQQKKNEITEDDLKEIEKTVQDLTDQYIKKIDDLTAEKDKELMAI